MPTRRPDSLSVLVVEDISADARLIEVLLREVHGSSLEIHTVPRMADAETAVSRRHFDVILLDLSLPDADRLETMQRMKAAAPDIPIVVLTIHDDEPLAIESLQEGAQDYLPKSELKATILKRSLRYAVERHRTEANRRSAEERSRVASELVSGEQRERRRLAAELHDHLAQLLATAILRVREARDRDRREPDPESLGEVERLLEESLQYTRTLVADMAPDGLFEQGICHAFEVLARNVERHGLRTVVESEEEKPIDLEPSRGELLYQSVRELLFNVLKHSGVHEARVRVSRSADAVEVTVADEGRGFEPGGAGSSSSGAETFGLSSIRNRVASFGGTFEIDSRPGAGTRATIRAPLSPRSS